VEKRRIEGIEKTKGRCEVIETIKKCRQIIEKEKGTPPW
jgi:hypothetical protein